MDLLGVLRPLSLTLWGALMVHQDKFFKPILKFK